MDASQIKNIIEESQQNNLENIMSNNTNKNPLINESYYASGSEATGGIEIDLVTNRVRNVQSRYLCISITNPKTEPDTETTGSIFLIDNQEAFESLKKFFTQLEWDS